MILIGKKLLSLQIACCESMAAGTTCTIVEVNRDALRLITSFDVGISSPSKHGNDEDSA